MLERQKNRIYRVLTALTVLLLLWCGRAALQTAQKVFSNASSPKSVRILLLLLGTLALVGAWLFLFARIDRMGRRGRVRCALLLGAGMLAVYIFLIVSLHIVPRNDSHSMLDQALYMAQSGTAGLDEHSVYRTYFSKYGNNYLLTLLFVYYFRLLAALHVTDLYTAIFALNACCLLAGCALSCLIARRIRGGAAAVKTLVLFACNPVYYLMTFWVYSNTLSIPFAMLLFYLGVCIYQARTAHTRLALGCLGSAVSVIAYEIRPTAVFPVLAFFFCWLFYAAVRRRKLTVRRLLRFCAALALMLGIAAGVYVLISYHCQLAFGAVSQDNYPVTHWLMMGSHGDGKYNTVDDRFTLFLPNDKKGEFTLRKTIENYQALGVRGTLKLWLTKTKTVWGDGWFDMSRRLNQMAGYSAVYQHLIGGSSFAVKYYSHCFWLAALLLTIARLTCQLTRRAVQTYDFLLMLVILGGIAFYCLWEVKAAYALSFLPFFFLLASGCTPPAVRRPHVRYASRVSLCALWLAVLFAAGTVQQAAEARAPAKQYSIRSYGSTWITSVPLTDGGTLTQSFYPNHAFNRIRLKVRVDDNGDRDAQTKDGTLQVRLLTANDTCVYEKTITAEDVKKKNRVTLDVGTQEAGSYTLVVTKTAGWMQDLILCTGEGMCLDSYAGTMTVEGTEKQTDLYMSVYQKE